MICYIIFLVHPLRKLRMIERELFERHETSRFYYLSIGYKQVWLATWWRASLPQWRTSGTSITSSPMPLLCGASITWNSHGNLLNH
jgi:hypothetical protein